MKNYFKKLSLLFVLISSMNFITAAEAAPIESSVFIIRPIQESDRQPLETFFENPEHLDYVGFPEEAGGREETMKVLFSKKPFYHTEIAESEEGKVAGFINYPLDVTEHVEAMLPTLATYPEEFRQTCIDMLKKQRTLLMLGVCEGFRRQGVAQKLVEKMKSDCKESGAEHIMVGVKTTNKPARAFYEKAGFTRNMPGMPVQEIPEEQKEQYEKVFETLPQQMLFMPL